MEEALSLHDHKTIKKLLAKDKKKKLLQQKYFNDQNALHIACDYGDFEIVKLLLKHKANANEIDNNRCCLQITCGAGYLDVVSLLLENGADPVIICSNGTTPLHLLVRLKPTTTNLSDFYSTLEQMKAAGANINERDANGNTALHVACSNDCEKNAMWLIRAGADISICNNKGETALHLAVRSTSKEFISLLLSAGASPLQRGEDGTALDYANKADRAEIIQLLANAKSQGDENETKLESIILNGIMISKDEWNNFKTQLTQQQKDPATDIHKKRFYLIEQLMFINEVLFDDNLDHSQTWKGILRFPSEDGGAWVSEYCTVHTEISSVFGGNTVRNIPLSGVLSIRADSATQFSIHYLRNGYPVIQKFSTNPNLVVPMLTVLVGNTKRPIEYINDISLLDILKELDPNAESNLRTQPTAIRKRRLTSARISMPHITRRNTKLDRVETVIQFSVTANGSIIYPIDLTQGEYSETFSPDIMQTQLGENKYLFTAGTLPDLVNYVILHSGHPKSEGNIDVKAFYLCYYRYCEPEEVISVIEEIWESHANTIWPSPYIEVPPDARLFSFLKGFLQSPFVLIDFDKEMQFREFLVELYSRLVPIPAPNRTSADLQKVMELVKKTKTKESISQLCDIGSLLGGGAQQKMDKIVSFDIQKHDVDEIAKQLVYINADLYGQLQVTELLDLRYEKNESFAVSLNKVHDFSNKIYLMVPTTILLADDPYIQRDVLKRWLNVSELLTQMRDYNSAIQIINGITETSISRLTYLREGLTTKWQERLERLEILYSPEGNFAKYRKLTKEPPCIPFVGVALKDLVYAYEGNPSKVANGSLNFEKMRLISTIVHSLKGTDYSHLRIDPQLAQELLNFNPLSQKELYARSVLIRDRIEAERREREDTVTLKKENKQMRDEIEKIRTENEALRGEALKKEEIIKNLKRQVTVQNSPNRGPQLRAHRKRSGSLTNLNLLT